MYASPPSVADTILVYVPKPRFSSKYSDVLRSPQKLKLFGVPIQRGTAMQKCGHRHSLGLCRACPKHLCDCKGTTFF